MLNQAVQGRVRHNILGQPALRPVLGGAVRMTPPTQREIDLLSNSMDIHTKEYYTPILYDLQKEGYDPKVKDITNAEEVIKKKLEAIAKSWERGARMPIGVFYKADYPSYEDHIMENMEAMKKAPLVKHDISAIDVEPLMEELVI